MIHLKCLHHQAIQERILVNVLLEKLVWHISVYFLGLSHLFFQGVGHKWISLCKLTSRSCKFLKEEKIQPCYFQIL